MSEAGPSLSLVIPTLNAASTLEDCLAALSKAPAILHEVIIVDGGSSDNTLKLARRAGAQVVEAPRGRGTQLAAGALAASGTWLLFLHADTRLDPGWPQAVAEFIADPRNRERAGAFRFALDDPRPAARAIERIVAWRCRLFGLPYGDQGLLIKRGFYESLGGFAPLPLMEDVDLVRRIGQRRLTILTPLAITSAVRYRAEGYPRRVLRNLICLALYFLGIPPRRIAALYEGRSAP